MRTSKHLARLSLLAAVSTALVGTAGLPGQAASSIVQITSANEVRFVGVDLSDTITATGGGKYVTITANAPLGTGTGCTADDNTDKKVTCTGSDAVPHITLLMAGGNDRVTIQTSIRTFILGQKGDDTYLGASTSVGTKAQFDGGEDVDHADYSGSSSGVLVDMGPGAGDGRLGTDDDNITATVENLTGTNHDDSLRGNNSPNRINGLLGADALRGGGGVDLILANDGAKDKADLSCGTGVDTIEVDTIDPAVSGDCENVNRD
ncbi:hypothetical protein GCM10022419_045820 [Nonomuraea rosea]|uniref:Calcium-binding protein n=1 Tax=Nonomuraea rosea TaxID=638574 RepID=A0ABP6X1M3_9ACTN